MKLLGANLKSSSPCMAGGQRMRAGWKESLHPNWLVPVCSIPGCITEGADCVKACIEVGEIIFIILKHWWPTFYFVIYFSEGSNRYKNNQINALKIHPTQTWIVYVNGKTKDLSSFERGMVVGARHTSLSRAATWLGFSHLTVSGVYKQCSITQRTYSQLNNCRKHWSQHGTASLWNTFDELRLFRGQKGVDATQYEERFLNVSYTQCIWK